MHTLNLLSKFCKYENWADLIKKNQSIRNTLYPYNLEKLNGFDGILSCSIKSNDFKVLRNYLMQFPYQTSETKCHIVGNEAFKSLLEYPKSCLSFYKSFCDVPIMRKSFFELLADPDFELPNYDIALQQYLKTTVKKGASIGANATIVCGNDLGEYCFIGAGTVITKEVLPYALMVGNPGKHVGWMSKYGHKLEFEGDGRALCPEGGEQYELKNGRVICLSEKK